MNTCGTHFIFAQDFAEFDPSYLAPTGFLLNGGEDEEVLFKAIQLAKPTITLSHTYGVAGTFGRIMQMLEEEGGSQGLSALQGLDATGKAALAWKVFNNKDISDKIQYFKSLSAVVRVIEAVVNRPSLFGSTVVTANPMVDDAEETLNKLATCLASASMNVQEAGARGSDHNAARSAWMSYTLLSSNCELQGRRSDRIVACSLVFSFLSTFATVMLTVLSDAAWARPLRNSDHWVFVQWAAIVIPATSTLLSTIIMTMNFSGKWATMKMASAHIVAQIYLFRGRVGRYNAAEMRRLNFSRDTDRIDLSKDNDSVLAQHAPATFVEEVQGIMQKVQDSDMGSDHLQAEDCIDLEAPNSTGSADVGLQGLDQKLYRGQLRASTRSGRLQDVQTSAGATWCGVLSTESYVQSRLLPLLSWAQEESRWVFWVNFWLRVAVFVSSSSTTIVVAFGLAQWAPVAMSLSTTLAAASYNMNLAARLSGLNQLITTLRNNLIFWNSITIVEKRMPHVRTHILSTTEQAVLAMVAAWTGGVTSVDSRSVSEEIAEEEPTARKGGKKCNEAS
mmetsp:Transcript_118232/g.376908  ORF Transcript_118232/g.376908 Transcript_118232/m.376908 type:complete len:561 (+) Transcript_118232:289-1971(+)